MNAGPLSHRTRIAVQTLAAGGVIAYPTEAVWGLGCDPLNQQAVMHLLSLKQRPINKGLILVAASIEQFAPYLEGLDDDLLLRAKSRWPGPTTWLVPANGFAPDWIRGDFQSVGLRVSAHPLVIELCNAFSGPIVSSSANRAGRPPCKWPWQIQRQWRGQLDWIVHGELGGASKPSEIRDLLTNKIMRHS